MTYRGEYDGFIFTHIPKCGGTSFRKYIKEGAQASGLSANQVLIPGQYGVSNETTLPRLNPEELSRVQKEVKVFALHGRYGIDRKFQLSTKRPFYYTLLRNPVDRFISTYRHFCIRRGDLGLAGVPLNDLSASKLHEVLQLYANSLVKYCIWVKKGDSFEQVFSPNNFDTAKENLQNHYAAFGLLERLEESLVMLREQSPSWLSFKGSFPFLNKGLSSNPPTIDPEIIKLIKIYNQYDLAFYQFAEKLFEKRWAQFRTVNDAQNKSEHANPRTKQKTLGQILRLVTRRK